MPGDNPEIIFDRNELCTIPLNLTNVSSFSLDFMNHGSTALRVDTDGATVGTFVLAVDSNIQTLLWARSSWSMLGLAPNHGDFAFRGECDVAMSNLLAAHFRSGLTVTLDDLGQGCVDLMSLKDVRVGSSHAFSAPEDLSFSESLVNLTLVFGHGTADNRTVEFLMPKVAFDVWFCALDGFVRAVRTFNRSYYDRRILWLQEQYLRGFSDFIQFRQPTPGEAIKVFNIQRFCQIFLLA